LKQRGLQVEIDSKGWRCFKKPLQVLDAGNSGTTIRLLTGLLAGSPFRSDIQGDDSLNRRPMERIIDPLSLMGADIRPSEIGSPPLKIKGTTLRAIRYPLPIASAQVKSCILLAGLTAHGTTTVVETTPSRDHTERAFVEFKAPFEKARDELSITGPADIEATELSVPGDFSSAVFFIVAALLLPGSYLKIQNIGVNPTRTGLLQMLEQSGANILQSNHRTVSNEPKCDLEIRHSEDFLRNFPTEISKQWVPIVIDEFPILAILGTRLAKGLEVHGAEELRKKESDRIHSIVMNLRNLGIVIEEFHDGFRILPGQKVSGGNISTFGDHRIAMSFTVAGLISENGVTLDNPDCANVSFPGFYKTLAGVSHR
jgi:3-phosphoshikimate 1-carboxyvinyltransferase